MVVVVVMMTGPVVMIVDYVEKDCPLAVVDMMMGLTAALVSRVEIVT